jgi:prepilin-type N-terminal cleavage/methylation domain-containing protein
MRQRGFTLIEVLIALLILSVVITTTLLIFVERTRRLQDATETILAYQALSNEAEVRRRIDFNQLDTTQPSFLSDTTLLDPLSPYSTYVTVQGSAPSIKNVTLFVRWRQGKRFAKLELVRVDTGGSNLW